MKDKIICIYKITSPSGKVYIGQTRNFYLREVSYRKGHAFKQRKLFCSFNKYGYDKHTVEIIEHTTIALLNEREKHWIAFYNSVDNGMNLTYGGDSYTRSKETNKIISESKMGSKNPMYGVKGILNKRFGTKATDETKEKLRISHLGIKTGKENSFFKGFITAYKDGVEIGVYEGIHDAAKKLNVFHNNVSKVILGKRKHTGGYTFTRIF